MSNTVEWDDLLDYIEEGRGIPIVGEQLPQAATPGGGLPLYAQVADLLKLDRAALPAQPSLNAVVCAHLAAHGDINEVYPKIRNILLEIPPDPPEPLRQLAAITGFGLYVSLTFDSLLATAINQAGFGGADKTCSLRYTPNGSDQAQGIADLPAAWQAEKAPTVFHLFGKASTAPDYVVSDEDLLEFVHALQRPDHRPPILFDELAANHLLFLGCRYSDWLARFLLRLSKNARLSGPRKSRETLVDCNITQDPSLVLFCGSFSSKTCLLPLPADEFIAELSSRWQQRHPPTTPSAAVPAAPEDPVADMTPGAIFISYASEDHDIARLWHERLQQHGLDAWLDIVRLKGGDLWESKIRRHIQECSLFIALVSRHTEDCTISYFRREWRWAAERAESIADGIPFILPLRVDYDGPPEDALVPGEFKKAQWIPRMPKPDDDLLKRLRDLVRDYQRQRNRGA
ncbi:MAG: toll/interleukin-1 receptor domain-containing protein [Candidatus Methylumidiphilus sp.]